MATVYPTSFGNWSTRTWFDDSTGAAYGSGTPQPGDTVLANNLAITIDVSIHVAALNNIAGTHASAGGTFTVGSSGLTSTVDTSINCGAAGCYVVTINGATTHTLTGSGLTITGSSTTNAVTAMAFSGTGTVNVTANATGGSGGVTAYAVANNSTGTFNITGNMLGSTAAAANNNSTGTLAVAGNATGGSGASSTAVKNAAGGTCSVSGTCTGGSIAGAYGASNATGVLTLNNVTGGSVVSAWGAANLSTGQLIINGTVSASSTSPAVGDTAASAGFIDVTTGPIVNSTGINAIVACHICISANVQWTISKPGVPPGYSGTATLKQSAFVAGGFDGGFDA